MADKVFIFFGCSWTFGKFINYQPGQELPINGNEEIEMANKSSYRALLSQTFDADQVNFSSGGSSNARQFRLAAQYFLGPNRNNISKARLLSNVYRKVRSESWPTVEEFITQGQLPTEILDEIQQVNHLDDFEIFRPDPRPKYVFWFITSTARIEYYNSVTHEFDNEFLTFPKTPLAKLLLANYYDHDYELERLTQQMSLWNAWFAHNNIRNIWIDTFNHHAYPMHVDNRLIFDSGYSDLMSNMCVNQGFREFKESDFHSSGWAADEARSEYLSQVGLLNSRTLHPTLDGHRLIADILTPKIVDHFDFR